MCLRLAEAPVVLADGAGPQPRQTLFLYAPKYPYPNKEVHFFRSSMSVISSVGCAG
jgi:hypothetical protein